MPDWSDVFQRSRPTTCPRDQTRDHQEHRTAAATYVENTLVTAEAVGDENLGPHPELLDARCVHVVRGAKGEKGSEYGGQWVIGKEGSQKRPAPLYGPRLSSISDAGEVIDSENEDYRIYAA